jgi:hypothetical protein
VTKRADEMGESFVTHSKKKNASSFSIGKPEVKMPLRISRRRWEDNIKTHLRYCGMDLYGK